MHTIKPRRICENKLHEVNAKLRKMVCCKMSFTIVRYKKAKSVRENSYNKSYIFQKRTTFRETQCPLLMQEGITTTRGSISKRCRKIGPISREHFEFIDRKMEKNNELTAMEFSAMLKTYFDVEVSKSTVQRLGRKFIN